jgi:hypothetical protein
MDRTGKARLPPETQRNHFKKARKQKNMKKDNNSNMYTKPNQKNM